MNNIPTLKQVHYPMVQKRDVVRVISMNETEYLTAQAKLDKNEDPFKDKHPKGYEHGLIIQCKDRRYQLFAKEYNFKELFVFVLNSSIQQRDKMKEDKNRREYNSVQRPTTTHEPILAKKEENNQKLTKNQSQINFYNKKSSDYHDQSNGPQDTSINETKNDNNSQEIRNNIHKQNFTQNIQDSNNQQRSSKKRHESMNMPNSRKHLLTSKNEDLDNSRIQKNSNNLNESIQNKKLHQNNQQQQSSDKNIGIDLSQPLQLKKLSNENQLHSEYLQREGNENITDLDAYKNQDIKQSNVRRKASSNLNNLDEGQDYQDDVYEAGELVQKNRRNTQNLENHNQLLTKAAKNEIPKPKSKNNTHRQGISNQEQSQSSNLNGSQQQEEENQICQIQNSDNQNKKQNISDYDKNLQQSLHSQNQDIQQNAQNVTDSQIQLDSAYNQTEPIQKPSIRQKSSRPPSHHGRQSQKNSGRELNNSNQKDIYGNLSIPSSAAKKHRKQIQERMELALKQLNDEQQKQEQQTTNNIQDDNSNAISQTEIINAQDQSLQQQQNKSAAKRRVKKRTSSRLSNNSNKKQDTPATVIESDNNENALNNSQLQIEKSQSQNILSNEDLQKLNELENVPLQVKQVNSSPNIHRRVMSNKKIPAKRQSDIIVIQPNSEHATEVINIRQRMSSDAKVIKAIKEKIQDVIDDRGSDLSGDDQIREEDAQSPSTTNIQLDLLKTNSYTSAIQMPSNIQVDNTNYYIQSPDLRQLQQQQRLRSTSQHEKFSSPIRERNIIMMHNQLKIASTPARQSNGKFESTYNHTAQPKVALSSKDLTGLQQQIPNMPNKQSQFANQQQKLINLHQVQDGTLGLLKDGSKAAQGNEKLIEMIKNNLTQLQKFSTNPIQQINSQQPNYENPYERQNSQNSNNIPILQNNSNSDIFHADATTRLQLLEKWDNKFGKSQHDEINQNAYDSYEWDREEDDFENSPSKNKKTGSNTTSHIKHNNNIYGNTQANGIQNYGFEQQVRKVSQKDLMKDLLQQPMLQTHFSSQSYKTSTNQNLHKKKQQSEQVLQEVEENQKTKKSAHKKTKSQVQSSIASKPIMFSQTSQLPNHPYNEYGGQPINIIQNFNINQLNLLNMCNQPDTNNFCQTHQTCNPPNNNAKFSSTFSQQNANQSQQKFQQDTQHMNILERIRMAHKTRGTNNQSENGQDQNDQNLSKSDAFNSQRQVNQSQLHIKSDPVEMIDGTEPVLKMPKSSKVPGQANRIKTTYQNSQNNFNNLLDSQHYTATGVYENNQVDKSDTYSVITKNSSSKSKIILKSSQIIKANQPNQINTFSLNKKRMSNNELLSPSYTQDNLVLIKQSKFFNPDDINLNSYTQDTQNMKARNSSQTPSPQKQKIVSQRLPNSNPYSNLNEGISNISSEQISQQQNDLLVQSINNSIKQKEEQQHQLQVGLKTKISSKNNQYQNIGQQIAKIQNPNDTFDYNWDDETLNNSTIQNKAGVKAGLKSKLKLSSIKNKGSLANRDDTLHQNNIKIDSVRKVIEENAQISIWD